MKKLFCLFLAAMFLLCAVPVSAAADLSDIEFKDLVKAGGGYPRLEELSDGTVIIVGGNVSMADDGTITQGMKIHASTDKGATWDSSYGKVYTDSLTLKYTHDGTLGDVEHTLVYENGQPFVFTDANGVETLFVSYRALTKSYTTSGIVLASNPFYTSIRMMKSTDGGKTFTEEVVLAEKHMDERTGGYWEPIMMQIDENTIACYFADDANVDNVDAQQKIQYVLYDIPTATWGSTVYTAIDGASRTPNSRDGMPGVTKLRSGGFAMVVEAHDYYERDTDADNNGTEDNCVFVVGLSLSEDGKTWSEPVPVMAPADINVGDRCSAPSISTLPDGRVVITTMSSDEYVGQENPNNASRNTAIAAIISDGALTSDTVLTPTVGGPAAGFTQIPKENVLDAGECGYTFWPSTFCTDDTLYIASGWGTNVFTTADDGTVTVTVSGKGSYVRSADVSGTVITEDINRDGRLSLTDALSAIKQVGKSAWDAAAYRMDIDASGAVEVKDVLTVIKAILTR